MAAVTHRTALRCVAAVVLLAALFTQAMGSTAYLQDQLPTEPVTIQMGTW